MSGEDTKRRGLGRGLSALLGEPVSVMPQRPAAAAVEAAGEGEAKDGDGSRSVRSLPVELLRPGKWQPRRVFDDERINDLVESVRDKGVLQPILARRHPKDPNLFEIIAGERRWRAAQQAQLHEVPVIVRDFGDKDAAEIALVENLQRQDLSPLEEAEGYRRLMDEFTHTQEDLSKAVGKSRSHVANMMRLLALPDPLKDMLDRGDLTAGHARALLTSDDPVKLARQVVSKGLNVRQTEKLTQKKDKPAKAKTALDKDADTIALERDLSNLLGAKVAIRFTGKGGELTIQYGSLEQLDDILNRLSQGKSGKAGDTSIDEG